MSKLVAPGKSVQVPGFLTGDFGKDFLEEYQGRAKADYENADVLNVLSLKSDVVTGSNSYAIVLANQILRQVGLRTVTPADVEKILKSGDLALIGVYVDTALILRSEDEPNEYLDRNLRKQLGKQNLPVMIPLAGLDLRVDQDAPYGLAFNIRGDTEIIYDEILNSRERNFSSEDINNKTGLPKKLGNGSRRFWTRARGLSRFFLGWGSSLGSYDWDLGNSYDCGRGVFAKDEQPKSSD